MASVSDATSRLKESYERDSQKQSQSYEDQLRSRNEEYNKRLLEIRSEAQGDVRKLKEDLYDRSGKNRSSEAMAITAERDQLSRYKDELDRETSKKVDRVEKMSDDRAAKFSRTENSKVEEALAAQNRSHQQEVSELNQQLDQYRNSGHDIDREKAQAKQSTIEEYEGQTIQERDRLVDAYEKSINKLHQKQDEMGEHYSKQLSSATSRVNNQSETQLRTQKEEFIQAEQNRRKEVDRIEERFNQEIQAERNRNDRTTNTLITQSSTDTEKALQSKDETYQAYLKDHKAKDDYERSDLEGEIKTLRTTGDTTKVSPYVVGKIERNAEMRNYAQLQEANAVHHKKLEAVRARDQDDRQALRQNYQESLTSYTREQQRGQDIEKKQFLGAFDDLQHLREEERRNLESRYSGTLERTENKRALESSLDQKRLRDELDEQRDLLRGEKIRTEDELGLKNKMESREWASRYNDLRRDMERKITEQSDAHETKVTELRYEFDKKLRDSNRIANRALDDRVKMYEHQIKQQELAFKEKERFLTEHYEEELDRMKQTNARLIQKKS